MEKKLADALKIITPPEPLSTIDRPLRVCFYADFGVGKTTLAMEIFKALEFKKGLLISADSAWTTVLNFEESNRVEKIDFKGFTQVRAIVEACNEGLPGYDYDCLIWDTVSTSHYNVVDSITDAKKFKDQIHDDAPGWTHYNLANRGIRLVIDSLKQSKLNVIYTAHSREPSQQEIDKGKLVRRAAMPEGAYKLLAQEVQLLGWLNVDRTSKQRVVQVSPTNLIAAKTQIPTIPDSMNSVPASQIPVLLKKWKEM